MWWRFPLPFHRCKCAQAHNKNRFLLVIRNRNNIDTKSQPQFPWWIYIYTAMPFAVIIQHQLKLTIYVSSERVSLLILFLSSAKLNWWRNALLLAELNWHVDIICIFIWMIEANSNNEMLKRWWKQKQWIQKIAKYYWQSR